MVVKECILCYDKCNKIEQKSKGNTGYGAVLDKHCANTGFCPCSPGTEQSARQRLGLVSFGVRRAGAMVVRAAQNRIDGWGVAVLSVAPGFVLFSESYENGCAGGGLLLSDRCGRRVSARDKTRPGTTSARFAARGSRSL